MNLVFSIENSLKLETSSLSVANRVYKINIDEFALFESKIQFFKAKLGNLP